LTNNNLSNVNGNLYQKYQHFCLGPSHRDRSKQRSKLGINYDLYGPNLINLSTLGSDAYLLCE